MGTWGRKDRKLLKPERDKSDSTTPRHLCHDDILLIRDLALRPMASVRNRRLSPAKPCSDRSALMPRPDPQYQPPPKIKESNSTRRMMSIFSAKIRQRDFVTLSGCTNQSADSGCGCSCGFLLRFAGAMRVALFRGRGHRRAGRAYFPATRLNQ